MNIMTMNHPSASEFDAQVQAYYTPFMPGILATEVLAEVEKRCGAGQQYCTFPNYISDAEKVKVESKGYKITKNYIEGKYLGRTEGEQYYIGFQVAMNATVQTDMYTMAISQTETDDAGIDGVRLLAVPDGEGG